MVKAKEKSTSTQILYLKEKFDILTADTQLSLAKKKWKQGKKASLAVLQLTKSAYQHL